jgi:hypothetical protein
MKLNVFSTIPFFSVLKHTSTWTSQRNWGSRTSYEGRNVPSVRGARQGTWNSGVRRRRFRRKNRIWNAADMSMTHSLAQHRGGGGNHSVALREDVATVSQKNEVETEVTVRSTADETTHQNHDEVKALQECKKPK